MAITQLNTRIKLRYDTYDRWNNNNPILLKGEIAIVEVPATSETTPNKLHDKERPSLLFKVGVDPKNPVGSEVPESTGYRFKQLPWGSALAADVYAWAKADHAPTATEIKMATNNNTTISSEISGLQAQINALTGNEGEGTSIANLITTAIENLDGGTDTGSAGEGKYVSAVTQEDGLVSVVYSDLPAEYDDTEIQALLAEHGTKISTLEGKVTTLEGKVTTLEGNSSTVGSVDYKIAQQAATDANAYAAKAYETKVDTLIGNDAGSSARAIAEDVVASVVDNAPASFDTLKEIADWISTAGDNEQTAADMVTDINALKTKTGGLTKTVDVEGTPTQQEATVKEYVDNAVATLSATVTTGFATKAEVQAAQTTATTADGKADANATAIATLNGTAQTPGSVAKAVADAKAELQTAIDNKVDGVLNNSAIATKDASTNEVTIKGAVTLDTVNGRNVTTGGTDVTLAPVAATGSVYDLTQANGTFLTLDGGDSTIDAAPQEP